MRLVLNVDFAAIARDPFASDVTSLRYLGVYTPSNDADPELNARRWARHEVYMSQKPVDRDK